MITLIHVAASEGHMSIIEHNSFWWWRWWQHVGFWCFGSVLALIFFNGRRRWKRRVFLSFLV